MSDSVAKCGTGSHCDCRCGCDPNRFFQSNKVQNTINFSCHTDETLDINNSETISATGSRDKSSTLRHNPARTISTDACDDASSTIVASVNKPGVRLFYDKSSFPLSATYGTRVKLLSRDIHGLVTYPSLYGTFNVYFWRNHPIRWVQACGIITEIQEHHEHIDIALDDSSGPLIDLRISDSSLRANLCIATEDDFVSCARNIQSCALKGYENERTLDIKRNKCSSFSCNVTVRCMKSDNVKESDRPAALSQANSELKSDNAVISTESKDSQKLSPIRVGSFATGSGELIRRRNKLYINAISFKSEQHPLAELDAWSQRLELRQSILSKDWCCENAPIIASE